MHFPDYIAIGVLIACGLAAAAVLSRRNSQSWGREAGEPSLAQQQPRDQDDHNDDADEVDGIHDIARRVIGAGKRRTGIAS
jgi:hypothetical protein